MVNINLLGSVSLGYMSNMRLHAEIFKKREVRCAWAVLTKSTLATCEKVYGVGFRRMMKFY